MIYLHATGRYPNFLSLKLAKAPDREIIFRFKIAQLKTCLVCIHTNKICNSIIKSFPETSLVNIANLQNTFNFILNNVHAWSLLLLLLWYAQQLLNY